MAPPANSQESPTPRWFASGNEAVGFLAMGNVATGVIAIGNVARGFIAIGNVAIGVFAFGNVALGVVSGFGLSVGVGAIGAALALGVPIVAGGSLAMPASAAFGPIVVLAWIFIGAVLGGRRERAALPELASAGDLADGFEGTLAARRIGAEGGVIEVELDGSVRRLEADPDLVERARPLRRCLVTVRARERRREGGDYRKSGPAELELVCTRVEPYPAAPPIWSSADHLVWYLRRCYLAAVPLGLALAIWRLLR